MEGGSGGVSDLPLAAGPMDRSTPGKHFNTFKTPVKCTPQSQYFHSHQFQTPGTGSRGPSASTPHQPLLAPHHLLHHPTAAASPSLHTPLGANATRSLRGGMVTPASLYLTPSSGEGNRVTPRFSSSSYTTPGGTNYKSVKNNPFDAHLLERMHSQSPMFSPDMFRLIEPGSAEKTPKSFRWSIDQIAILKPADIEEMPLQTDTLNIRCPDVESKAQYAIEKYFDKDYILPSPWAETVQKFVLPRTPGGESPSPELIQPTVCENTMEEATTKEASCQTKFTIPVDFDLGKLLGDKFVYSGGQVAEGPGAAVGTTDCLAADISTSSLRRKLFFHGDEGTPLSPVRCSRQRVASEVMDMSSPVVSPVQCDTPPCQGRLSPIQTPSTGQFSSSPIRGLEGHMTPSIRRCSTSTDMMPSPQFSPIDSGGGCGPHGYGLRTPACAPLQATPSSGRPSSQALGSPGMSPISLTDGSYMASPDRLETATKSDSLRRRALRGGHVEKPPVPRELQMSGCASPASALTAALPHSHDTSAVILYDENAQDVDMSCDGVEAGGGEGGYSTCHSSSRIQEVGSNMEDAKHPQFTDFRDHYDDFDATENNTLGFYNTSVQCVGGAGGSQSNSLMGGQDTGYHTGAFSQLLSNDTHTNITTHFSSLQPPNGQLNDQGEHSSLLDSHSQSGDSGSNRKYIVDFSHLVSTPTSSITGKTNGESGGKLGGFNQVPSRVLFSDFTKSEDGNNRSVSPVEGDVIPLAKRPSSLIFSELENLTRKSKLLTSSQSCSNTPVMDKQHSGESMFARSHITAQSHGGGKKTIAKSFSTNDMKGLLSSDMQSEEAPPHDVNKYAIMDHSRRFTRGSMINHEMVYEPPVYVMTSHTHHSSHSQDSQARNVPGYSKQHSYSSDNNEYSTAGKVDLMRQNSMPAIYHSSESNSEGNNNTHKQWHIPTTNSHISSNSLDGGNSTAQKTSRVQFAVGENKKTLRADDSLGDLYRPFKKLYQGRPAGVNPAFTIETLTPDVSAGQAPLGSGTRTTNYSLNKNAVSLGERLLSPTEHPSSPADTSSEVMQRARRALGHTLTDKAASHPPPSERPSSARPWYEQASHSGSKLPALARAMEKRKRDVTSMMPSDVALQVLQKAEADLTRLQNGEALDPSFLDLTSFHDSCLGDEEPDAAEV